MTYWVLMLLSAIAFYGCSGGSCNVVPNRSFATTISQAEHIGVFSAGGYAYAKGGYAGLIVHNIGTQSAPRLVAYDRCSTVDPGAGNQVEVQGQLIVDPVSGAKWMLMDGSPAAIAECPLKPYNVTQTANTLFRVQN